MKTVRASTHIDILTPLKRCPACPIYLFADIWSNLLCSVRDVCHARTAEWSRRKIAETMDSHLCVDSFFRAFYPNPWWCHRVFDKINEFLLFSAKQNMKKTKLHRARGGWQLTNQNVKTWDDLKKFHFRLKWLDWLVTSSFTHCRLTILGQHNVDSVVLIEATSHAAHPNFLTWRRTTNRRTCNSKASLYLKRTQIAVHVSTL